MKGSGEKENGGSRHDDAISRRAVIDFVGSMEMCDQITADAYKDLICYLEELPPAPPEIPDGNRLVELIREIIDALPLIRCKDCKWFGTTGCAIMVVDDSDKPTEDDYCSFAERREE